MDAATRQAVKQALDLRDDLLARTVQNNSRLREVNAELREVNAELLEALRLLVHANEQPFTPGKEAHIEMRVNEAKLILPDVEQAQ